MSDTDLVVGCLLILFVIWFVVNFIAWLVGVLA